MSARPAIPRRAVTSDAVQLHYTGSMKTATLPAVRVEPALREELERVLRPGETLSAFVETAVRDNVRQRLNQAEFIARGIASIDAARRSGHYIDAGTLVDKLQHRLDVARARRKPTTKGP